MTVEDSSKRCPDCSEDVRVDANVCRHCGYRFDGRLFPRIARKLNLWTVVSILVILAVLLYLLVVLVDGGIRIEVSL